MKNSMTFLASVLTKQYSNDGKFWNLHRLISTLNLNLTLTPDGESKRVMVDVFVRSVEGFLMAESWTSNQAQVRVDEHFTAPRQVQSRYFTRVQSSRRKPSLNLFRSLCQNLVSFLVLILLRRSMLIFNGNFFFLVTFV